MTPRLLVVLVLSCLLAVGCGDTPGDVLPDPRDGRSGIQLSGQLQGRQLALSDGLPRLEVGDCDPADGPDEDVCIITRDIHGELIVVVFENPAVLADDVELPIGPGDCSDPQACDAVTDVAIIDVQIGTGARIRAESGLLRMEVVEPGERYRGDFRLRLPDGSNLRATFDLVPRPDEIS